ncbi:hypothetical protein LTR10_020315 [Elasticomyces elasticus]|uniref:Leo1-like protein n=1 Tax=Exophiala sideris TaxID=1016849 RepID=A0ABR0J7N1_9EURO|nr:hypothetical protein LTR10_020315 [Elasticomyces elasticus]KAK5029972.1 hypothetical protein LTS07_005696 [Exophiala sideris]KAK5031588.1 hypothetical protein LTR13_007577 [Exophiala sideris]KAK5058266.1 hypothetical protein LTR69_006670 [Exophiala sideris]KAK5180195.1 hypothetical protein LTR44_007320 [Eurotiomycetes sp. CCFEE 6388]
MSAEVDSLPQNGELGDHDIPENLNGEDASGDDGDLFGDDDDELDQGNDLNRKLDDSELDSGDDEGRADRIAATVEDEEEVYGEQKQLKLLDVDMHRVKFPEGEELYILNMPPFLGIKHQNFNPKTYEIPDKPHDGRDPAVDPTAKFSPFSTAASQFFWRRDPKNPELLQSNSRIVRWSDGSLTLQISSSPKDHYRISTTALRQGWPRKPGQPQPDYDPNRDTHNYLAVPHSTVGVDMEVVAPFDASMKIQATGDLADESVLLLQKSLAAATQQHDPLNTITSVKKDPEEAKRAAEAFEKEKMRAQRKLEGAQDRLLTRRDRVLGRSGLGRSGGGLTLAGLEDDDGMPSARGIKAKARARRPNRRGDIYSDDEDEDLPRGRGREDEYDREDDFLANSDEEPEIYDDEGAEVEAEEDDDPDVDDLEIEGRETVINNRTRGGPRERDRDSTPKRAAADDDDEVAPQGSPQQRKKRRVIDDDEDE